MIQPLRRLLESFDTYESLRAAVSMVSNNEAILNWILKASDEFQKNEQWDENTFLQDLLENFDEIERAIGSAPNLKPRIPREHQENARHAMVEEYLVQSSSDTKPADLRLIVEEPCGSGKSYLSAITFADLLLTRKYLEGAVSIGELSESLAMVLGPIAQDKERTWQILENLPPMKEIVLLAPNTGLLRQLQDEWNAVMFMNNTSCKWIGVGDALTPGETPFTTDPKQLKKLATEPHDKDLQIRLCTYKSLPLMKKAGLHKVDFALLDEVHRISGNNEISQQDKRWNTILSRKMLQASVRLNMTASPKLYLDSRGFSMTQDNAVDIEKTFGPYAHRMSLKEAIKYECVSDFDIRLDPPSALTEKLLKNLRRAEVLDRLTPSSGTRQINAETYYKELVDDALAVINLRDTHQRRKIVVYYDTIQHSKDFAVVLAEVSKRVSQKRMDIIHVDSTSVKKKEAGVLQFRLQKRRASVLTNCGAFREGSDVRDVDSLYYAQHVSSGVETIQTLGRALRRYKNKRSLISIPIREDSEQMSASAEMAATLLGLRHNNEIVSRGHGGTFTTDLEAESHIDSLKWSKDTTDEQREHFNHEIQVAFAKQKALRSADYRFRTLSRLSVMVLKERNRLPEKATSDEILALMPAESFVEMSPPAVPKIETLRTWIRDFHPEFESVDKLLLANLHQTKTINSVTSDDALEYPAAKENLLAMATLLTSSERLKVIDEITRRGFGTWVAESSFSQTTPTTALRVPVNIPRDFSALEVESIVEDLGTMLDVEDHQTFISTEISKPASIFEDWTPSEDSEINERLQQAAEAFLEQNSKFVTAQEVISSPVYVERVYLSAGLPSPTAKKAGLGFSRTRPKNR